MDKVQGFMFPNAGAGQDDGVPWWMKYAGKAAGIVGGIGKHIVGNLGLTLIVCCAFECS